MKYICFDFGDSRTGVACSDVDGKMAFARDAIEVKGLSDAISKTLIVVKEVAPDAIVVGLPISLSGTESHRAERTRRFASGLSEASGLPVHLYDERLTTVQADTYLSQTGVFGRKRKNIIDSLSAQIILQAFLDSHSR